MKNFRRKKLPEFRENSDKAPQNSTTNFRTGSGTYRSEYSERADVNYSHHQQKICTGHQRRGWKCNLAEQTGECEKKYTSTGG